MTKADLLRFLEPFSDDIQIIVRNGYNWVEILGPMYAQREGEGLAALVTGDRVSPPTMVSASKIV